MNLINIFLHREKKERKKKKRKSHQASSKEQSGSDYFQVSEIASDEVKYQRSKDQELQGVSSLLSSAGNSCYKQQLKPLNYNTTSLSLRHSRHPGLKTNVPQNHVSYQPPYLPPTPNISRPFLQDTSNHSVVDSRSDVNADQLYGLNHKPISKQSGYGARTFEGTGNSSVGTLKPLQTYKDWRSRHDTSKSQNANTDLSSLKETPL